MKTLPEIVPGTLGKGSFSPEAAKLMEEESASRALGTIFGATRERLAEREADSSSLGSKAGQLRGRGPEGLSRAQSQVSATSSPKLPLCQCELHFLSLPRTDTRPQSAKMHGERLHMKTKSTQWLSEVFLVGSCGVPIRQAPTALMSRVVAPSPCVWDPAATISGHPEQGFWGWAISQAPPPPKLTPHGGTQGSP